MAGGARHDVLYLNAVRADIAAVKAEVRSGDLPPDHAVRDPRTAPIRVRDLLGAQWKWGSYMSQEFAREIGVRSEVRIRDLSEREIDRLEFALWLRRVLPRRRWYERSEYRKALIRMIRA